MSDIRELNKYRTDLQFRLQAAALQNTPFDPEKRLAADAAYKLLMDAYLAAEREYSDALSKLTAAELRELTN